MSPTKFSTLWAPTWAAVLYWCKFLFFDFYNLFQFLDTFVQITFFGRFYFARCKRRTAMRTFCRGNINRLFAIWTCGCCDRLFRFHLVHRANNQERREHCDNETDYRVQKHTKIQCCGTGRLGFGDCIKYLVVAARQHKEPL